MLTFVHSDFLVEANLLEWWGFDMLRYFVAPRGSESIDYTSSGKDRDRLTLFLISLQCFADVHLTLLVVVSCSGIVKFDSCDSRLSSIPELEVCSSILESVSEENCGAKMS